MQMTIRGHHITITPAIEKQFGKKYKNGINAVPNHNASKCQ